MKRQIFGTLALALCVLLTLAASSSRWQHVPAKDHLRPSPLAGHPDAAAAGALVYREHCQQCHKADAMGDGHKHPPLRSERIRNASDGDIEWFLRQGDLAHGMPSWSSLPETQRWQVVAYLKSIQ
ncbi:MAG TPA: cytochrome c [Chthonomonadales bacterium]|nr:cytochrome c [Chthonomonadales bacterium]